MIFIDDSVIKVGGVILPGIIKSLEIKADATVEEQKVEGNSAKPKQAIGYEDAKITLEIALEDGVDKTKEEKLKSIQNLFKKSGQLKPIVYEIINQHTSIRGIKKIIFKSLSTKETSKKSELTVSIEFWEYIPITITASKSTNNNSASTSAKTATNLNSDYETYLSNSRGGAPKVNDKTNKSPARDTANGLSSKNRLDIMPY